MATNLFLRSLRHGVPVSTSLTEENWKTERASWGYRIPKDPGKPISGPGPEVTSGSWLNQGTLNLHTLV